MSEDRSGQTVNSALCTYTSLNRYNQPHPDMSPPVPSSTAKGCYVVPLWPTTVEWAKKSGYQNLTMGKDCAGYPSIVNAYSSYGMNAANCNPTYGASQCMPGARCSM